MKKLTSLFLFSVLVAVFCSCEIQQPISYKPADNNADYHVSYLFEHDGCKVYRFVDEGRYVYFTSINSDVTMIPNDSTVINNTVRVDTTVVGD